MPHIVIYDDGAVCSLKSIADQICSRTSSDHCSIFLVKNPETMLLCATTAPRLSERVGNATYHIGEGLTGSVYKSLSTINVNLQSANKKRIIEPDFRWRSKHNEGSMFTGWMGSPVIYNNYFLGVVRIMRVHEIFSESEKAIFEEECARLSRLLYEAEITESAGKFDLVTNLTFDQPYSCIKK
jgi:signal transduction protein with GAF and PtsI domain